MWNPGELATGDVENYLSKSQEAVQSGGVGSLPLGAHVRDDEQVHDHYKLCLKITEKVSFNIASEFWMDKSKSKIPKIVHFMRVFENLKLAVKQCYQTGHFK